MVLGDDFHGKVVFQNRDVRMAAYGPSVRADFKTRVVGVVQDAESESSAFTVQVEIPPSFLSVLTPHFTRSRMPCGAFFHYLFHGCRVADETPCNHGVP